MLPTAPKTREDIVQDCKNNIAQIIDRAHSIEADIIVSTIFPLGKGNIPLSLRPFWSSVSEMEQSINEVNEYIRTLSDRAVPPLELDRVAPAKADHAVPHLELDPWKGAYGDRVIVFDAYSLLNQRRSQ